MEITKHQLIRIFDEKEEHYGKADARIQKRVKEMPDKQRSL